MRLRAGERYRLTDSQCFAQLLSGVYEIYAVTRDGEVFHQIFLAESMEGEAVFPLRDDYCDLDIQLYAVTEGTVELLGIASVTEEQLGAWYRKLSKLEFIRLLIDRGDALLAAWADGTILIDRDDSEKSLLECYWENQEIFSMLLSASLRGMDARANERLKRRSRRQRLVLDEAVGNLLGDDLASAVTGENVSGLGDIAFAVQRAAAALHMPVSDISMPLEMAKNLDSVQILQRLVQKANMQVRLVRLQEDWWKKDSGILLVHVGREAKMGVLVPDAPGSYRLLMQEQKEGIPLTEEAVGEIDKQAFLCYGGLPAKKLKVLDFLKFMFHQCWKQDYGMILAASFLAGLVPLCTPIITETVFQDIIPIRDFGSLTTVTQVMLVTSFTLAAMGIVRSIAVLRITTHLDMAAEAALWNRLLTLPTKFFRQFKSGELAVRMGSLNSLKGIVSGEFVGSIFNFFFSFWSILLMCYYSLKLTAVAVGIWLVYSVVVAFIYRRVLTFQRESIRAENESAGMVQQIFAGLSKFRVQGAEEQAFLLWSRVFGEQWKWNLKLRWQGNYNSVILSVQPFILNMLLYYMAVYGINEVGPDGKTMVQGITYAQFLAFSAAYGSFNGTLNGVLGLVGTFFSIQPHIENLKPILEELPEVNDDRMDAPELTGKVEFSHISFSYGEESPEVLHDVSFSVRAGENLAIVGKSGSGKSTLMRLLLGFEEPTHGAIYFDGQDLKELRLSSVRSQMGVVMQNGQLMTGDIFTNIVGTANLSQDDAWRAAAEAGIAEDIMQMPMGMQTVISEGSSNISGGQRQRLMIARAFAKNPKLLVFDEATSALDNRTQAIITRSLQKRHATRIVVAHRLSTIRDADRILVVDNGRIAEEGTFDELMEKNGVFARLASRQMA